ncbi:MAG: hypothetical protein ACO260_10750, partial [Hylemonella sp.]
MATAANAAPEEETGDEAEVKPKKSIVKIILGVVGLLVLLAGTVFGTLFFSGYFNPKPPVDPESAEAAEKGANPKDKKDAKPSKLSKKSPEITRFDYQYKIGRA